MTGRSEAGVVPIRGRRRGAAGGVSCAGEASGRRYGDVGLPLFEEMERALQESRGGKEMATLMEARTREFEERAIAGGIAQGREQAFEEMERASASSREPVPSSSRRRAAVAHGGPTG